MDVVVDVDVDVEDSEASITPSAFQALAINSVNGAIKLASLSFVVAVAVVVVVSSVANGCVPSMRRPRA